MVGKATWDQAQNGSYPYPFASWRNVSDTWVPTPLNLQPQLWATVDGEYAVCNSNDANLLCVAFADAASGTFHVVLHNLRNDSVTTDVDMGSACGKARIVGKWKDLQ